MSNLDQKKEKRMAEGKPKRDKGEGQGKKRSVMFACLGEEEEMGPRNVEIPESGSNSARRHINMANVLWGYDWGRKN